MARGNTSKGMQRRPTEDAVRCAGSLHSAHGPGSDVVGVELQAGGASPNSRCTHATICKFTHVQTTPCQNGHLCLHRSVTRHGRRLWPAGASGWSRAVAGFRLQWVQPMASQRPPQTTFPTSASPKRQTRLRRWRAAQVPHESARLLVPARPPPSPTRLAFAAAAGKLWIASFRRSATFSRPPLHMVAGCGCRVRINGDTSMGSTTACRAVHDKVEPAPVLRLYARRVLPLRSQRLSRDADPARSTSLARLASRPVRGQASAWSPNALRTAPHPGFGPQALLRRGSGCRSRRRNFFFTHTHTFLLFTRSQCFGAQIQGQATASGWREEVEPMAQRDGR